MPRREGRWAARLLISGLWLASVAAALAQFIPGAATAKGFKVPEYDGEKRIRSLFMGEEAKSSGNNAPLAITGMKLESYSYTQGTQAVDFVVSADDCLFEYTKRRAYSAGPIRMHTGDGKLHVSGTGFLWVQTNAYLVISNDVKTSLQKDFSRGKSPSPALKSSGTNDIIHVTSDLLEAYHSSNRVIYSGHVRLVDPAWELTCDLLTVERTEEGEFQRIVAERNVVMVNRQDGSRAYGDTGVYSVTDQGELLTLSGNARWEDATRKARARRFTVNPRTRVVRAEGNAFLQLPRTGLAQADWLFSPTKPKTTATTPDGLVEITGDTLTMEMGDSSTPSRRVIAEGNVAIISSADQSRAVCQRAVFSETTGLLELIGNASWEAEQRIVKGGILTMNSHNRTFSGRTNAFVRLPVSAFGNNKAFSNTALQTVSTNVPQFMEVASQTLDYENDLLTFRKDVRARYLEGEKLAGTMSSEALSVKYREQVEQIIMDGNFRLEQLPVAQTNGGTMGKTLSARRAVIDIRPTGFLDQLVMDDHIEMVQTETSTNAEPVVTRVVTEHLTSLFFATTNDVEKAWATGGVKITQGDAFLEGARADYSSTNQQLQITGNPMASFPGGSMKDADMLVWDREQQKLSAIGKYQSQWQRTNSPPARTNLPAASKP